MNTETKIMLTIAIATIIAGIVIGINAKQVMEHARQAQQQRIDAINNF